jgi:hypothetical protein
LIAVFLVVASVETQGRLLGDDVADDFSISFDFPSGAPSSPPNPYLLPPGWSTVTGDPAIRIENVNGPGADVTAPILCAISPVAQPKASQDVFGLNWWAQAPGAASDTDAVVTVKAAAVNIDTDAGRGALHAAFLAFRDDLAELQGRKNGANACLPQGAADVIADRVAQALPLRLSEILNYHFRFNSVGRSIDLVPGMRLRVEAASFSNIGPEG